MNHSMHSADSRTHMKVFALGLFCALVVAAVGTYGHIGATDVSTEPLVKAGRTITMTGDSPVIR
jgi:hypothetical protein